LSVVYLTYRCPSPVTDKPDARHRGGQAPIRQYAICWLVRDHAKLEPYGRRLGNDGRQWGAYPDPDRPALGGAFRCDVSRRRRRRQEKEHRGESKSHACNHPVVEARLRRSAIRETGGHGVSRDNSDRPSVNFGRKSDVPDRLPWCTCLTPNCDAPRLELHTPETRRRRKAGISEEHGETHPITPP
jgi:hypothetical protein